MTGYGMTPRAVAKPWPDHKLCTAHGRGFSGVHYHRDVPKQWTDRVVPDPHAPGESTVPVRRALAHNLVHRDRTHGSPAPAPHADDDPLTHQHIHCCPDQC